MIIIIKRNLLIMNTTEDLLQNWVTKLIHKRYHKFLCRAEVARLLNCTTQTVSNLTYERKLKKRRNHVLGWHLDDLIDYLEETSIK